MKSAPTIGIDIGGTKIAAGVVGPSGAIFARREIPTDSGEPSAIVTAIVKMARELRAAAPATVAVGVGAAALVDVEHGVVLTAPNIAWRDLHLRTMIEERLGLPAVVDNDANVAAWGEALHGAGRGARHLIALTLGTGIGGGLVLDGHLYRGAHGVGAELGHMVVDPCGPPCPCGNQGCLEAMASGNAIGRMARERAAGHLDSKVVAAAGGDPSAITGRIVGDAALAGDLFAREVVAEAGRALGVALGSLANIFDPEVIVVAGGAAEVGDLILSPARERMQGLIIGRDARPPVRVVPASLGPDAGLVGAAALAREIA
ncbi:MAG: ROK family glucokinase [Acidobacteria bacterium]|nr:ROK family glucokinase [Acidobacteriota bacterium]